MGVLGRLLVALGVIGAVSAAAGWVLTEPKKLDAAELAALHPGDAKKGERIFYAGGCASCHAAPGAKGDDRLKLGGGVRLKTNFGTFVTPNISSDKADGIGGWSDADLANAMLRGVAPDGSHFYPAFPYTSYARMASQDVSDLQAFLQTLPAVQGKQPPHELRFPFTVRRGVGLWKKLYLSPEPVLALPADAPEGVKLGQSLVEGPAHCGECHTPRDFFGGLKKGEWLAGAAAAEGQGNVPNITPGEGGIGDWSAGDIATMLESGLTPEFDSVGGSMADVVHNTAKLAPEDRAAIAAYLKAVPPHPNGYAATSKAK